MYIEFLNVFRLRNKDVELFDMHIYEMGSDSIEETNVSTAHKLETALKVKCDPKKMYCQL